MFITKKRFEEHLVNTHGKNECTGRCVLTKEKFKEVEYRLEGKILEAEKLLSLLLDHFSLEKKTDPGKTYLAKKK
jgi:hypothetical protein